MIGVNFGSLRQLRRLSDCRATAGPVRPKSSQFPAEEHQASWSGKTSKKISNAATHAPFILQRSAIWPTGSTAFRDAAAYLPVGLERIQLVQALLFLMRAGGFFFALKLRLGIFLLFLSVARRCLIDSVHRLARLLNIVHLGRCGCSLLRSRQWRAVRGCNGLVIHHCPYAPTASCVGLPGVSVVLAGGTAGLPFPPTEGAVAGGTDCVPTGGSTAFGEDGGVAWF